MAFGSKKKAKSAPTYNDTDLINELCDIVDCNVEELKQVVEDLCSFEEDGGAFIDGIAKILDCDEDAIYDEIKRIKELAESAPSEGTSDENETDEEVESAKQVVEELLKLFDCTDENLLDRVQSTQKLANQYYSVIVSLCEMLNCTTETVAETVQSLIDSKGTSEETSTVDPAELDTLKEEVSKLQTLLGEEKTSSQKYKDACTDSEKKLNLYKSELSESKKEVKQLTEQVNKAKDIIRSTRKYRDELSESNEALKKENEALKKEKETLVSQSGDSEVVKRLEDELSRVNRDLAATVAQCEEKGTALEATEKELKGLGVKYQELLGKSQDTSAMDTLQKLNCELKQKSHSLEEELSRVQKEQAKTEENLSAAEENVANLLTKVNDKTSELSKKDEELQAVHRELSEVMAKISGYEDKLSRVSELETEIEVYKEKEVQYTKMLEEITVAVDKQQENDGKSILNRLCTKFDCNKEALEEVISIALEGKMPEEDSFQSLSIELVKLRSENRVLRKNTELDSQIVSSLRRIFDDCYVEQLYDEVVKAKEQAERVPSLDEEVSSLKTSVDTLQTEVEESRKAHKDITEADKSLKDKLEQVMRENEDITEELNSTKKTLFSCKIDRKSLRDKNISLTSELESVKDTLRRREEVSDNLRNERDSLKMRLDDVQTDLINARVEGKKSSDRCTELQKRLAKEKEKQDNSEELVRYRVQVEDLNEALETERTRSSELQDSVNELTEGKDKLLERIRSRDDMIESLKKEVEVHKASAKRLGQRLETDSLGVGTED